MPGVSVVIQKEPFQTFIKPPLDKLADLVSHEIQLASAVAHLIHQKEPQPCELPPIIPWHPLNQRAFSMNDFIVRKGQNKILIKGVHHGKSQKLMAPVAEGKVQRAVSERIVHPSHIPFVVKAEPSFFRRVSDQGPGGAFLGNREYIGMESANYFIKLLKECLSHQIFLAAFVIKALLRRIVNSIIQIEHTADSVYPYAVDMVFFQPENRVANEKTADFRAAIIKFIGSPLYMFFGFKKLRPVEPAEPMSVPAKVARNPVQDNTNPCLMETVNQIFKVFGQTITAGRSVVSGSLIAPGSIKRMFHNRHQFHMSIAHIFYIRGKFFGKLTVGEKNRILRVFSMLFPGTQVNFIYIHGFFKM